MYNNRSRGFTLIELLVVIAIIGILSAVVLASLNTARTKGNDAAIQSNLSTVHVQAELYYGTGNTYGAAGSSCAAAVFSDPTIVNAIAAAEVANGSGNVVCNNTTSAYAISSALQAGVGGEMFWCVDSTGNATSHASALGNATVCP